MLEQRGFLVEGMESFFIFPSGAEVNPREREVLDRARDVRYLKLDDDVIPYLDASNPLPHLH